MLRLTPVLVPLLVLVSGPEPGLATGGFTEAQCEELNLPLCANMPYNLTRARLEFPILFLVPENI